MTRTLNSFKIRSGSKILDYRLGENLNLDKVKSFFQKNYRVKKLWNGRRHVLGILTEGSATYFLKLSTTEGISVVTKNEYDWNDYFNKYFPTNSSYLVPKNYDSGLYQNKYFYLITDYFNGKLLCNINATYENTNQLIEYIPRVIAFSEVIQQLPAIEFTKHEYEESDYKVRFINKVKGWFNDIPVDVRKKYRIRVLLEIVEKGISKLSSKPRHGDFTPWHMIKLPDKKLGLIDGEHFLPNGVEGYDICYFIQRVLGVLRNSSIAADIYTELLYRGYEKNKLKTVLAARAIGGFLDESLKEKPDYQVANQFKDWVITN